MSKIKTFYFNNRIYKIKKFFMNQNQTKNKIKIIILIFQKIIKANKKIKNNILVIAKTKILRKI